MTIAAHSNSSDELRDGIPAHGEVTESGQHPKALQNMDTEEHEPGHAEGEPALPEPASEAVSPTEPEAHAAVASLVDLESVALTEDASPVESAPGTDRSPSPEQSLAEIAQAEEPAVPTDSAVPSESPALAEADPVGESAPLGEASLAEDRPPTEIAQAEEPAVPTDSAVPSEVPAPAEPDPVGESAPLGEASLAEDRPPTEIEQAKAPAVPTDSAGPSEAPALAEAVPVGESAPLTGSAKPGDAARSTEASSLTGPAPPAENPPPGESVLSTESARPVELAAPAQLAPQTEPAPVTAPVPPTEAVPLAKPPSSQASALLLFVAAFLVFAVLVAGGAALTLGRTDSAAAPGPEQQPPPAPMPVTKVLGTVDSRATGLKGQLTTKWDDGLKYDFVIEPDDPARQPEFALLVSNPPRPASVRIQIKNSDGIVVCSQDVLLKFDPRKAAAISDASMQSPRETPLRAKAAQETKNENETEFARKDAEEADREHGRNIFQLNAAPDGKIQSISSQGEIPCPQILYEGMGYWSFLPDFPSPEEQTERLNRLTAVHAIKAADPAP